ncbi:MAG: 30S ribosomal protein S20 [Firmicutes bacterium]|nr:30S ribosomal protein S20 [Bacillota bacterium]
MAKNRSAMKKARIARIRTLRNASRKSAMKTAIKRFEEALASGEETRVEAAFKNAIRLIDKTASKGIIHPNLRDRKKAQLARKLKAFFRQGEREMPA